VEEVQTAKLAVPGAELYFKSRGTGPLLLIIQGGAADAEGSDALAELLCDRYRVVSYDRRGLSRSPLAAGGGVSSLAEHGDDVQRLLLALSAEPAYVLGVSIGALIGLDLIARYPERVRKLVAYEPPATELLPDAVREAAVAIQEELETTYARDGGRAAVLKFLSALGGDFGDVEPGFQAREPSPYLLGNVTQLLEYDAPAVRRHRLQLAELGRQAARIVPALGARSQEALLSGVPGAALKAGTTLALAAQLGVDVSFFQGGHGAYATHPRSFAARLHQILSRPW
jgi:pimeloyl-ACP methyl ester carboxylesterase